MKRWLIVIGVLVFVATISACGMRLGDSFHMAKRSQILNPEAGKNQEPVYGLDGRTAQVVMERYHKEFEKPTPPSTYAITIGGIGK